MASVNDYMRGRKSGPLAVAQRTSIANFISPQGTPVVQRPQSAALSDMIQRPAGSGGSMLPDDKKAVVSNLETRISLAKAGRQDPTKTKGPTGLERVLAWMDAASLVTRVPSMVLLDALGIGELPPYKPPAETAAILEEGFIPSVEDARRAKAAGIDLYKQHEAQTEAEQHNVFLRTGAEMAKAGAGELGVSYSDYAKQSGVENPVAQFLIGLGGDIASDWLTYVGGGFKSATKAALPQKIMGTLKNGIDLDMLVRHVDDVDDAVSLEQRLVRDFTTEYAAKGYLPKKAQQAAIRRTKNIMKKLAPNEKQLERGATLQPIRVDDLPAKLDQDLYRGLSIKLAGEMGDRGGFKFFGKTVVPVQDEMMKASQAAKNTLRKAKAFRTIEGWFNTLQPIAAKNRPLEASIFDEFRKQYIKAGTAGRNEAVQWAKKIIGGDKLAEVAPITDPRVRHLMSFAVEEVLSPEQRRSLGTLYDKYESARKAYARVMDEGEEGAQWLNKFQFEAEFRKAEKEVTKFIEKNLDVTAPGRFMREHGANLNLPEDQVEEAIRWIERTRNIHASSAQTLREQGLGLPEVLGELSQKAGRTLEQDVDEAMAQLTPASLESVGYIRHMERHPSSLVERFLRGIGRPGRDDAARLAVYDELGLEPGARKLVRYQASSRKSLTPTLHGAGQGREMQTLRDWLKEGYIPETDFSLLTAGKIQRDRMQLAKARLQGNVAQWFGQPLKPGEKAMLQDERFSYNVTRIIPRTVKALEEEGKTVAENPEYLPTFVKNTRRYAIPLEVRNTLDNLERVFINEESFKDALTSYDKWMNVWRRMATTWNIGFHTRNAVSNYILAYLGDPKLGDPRGWMEAGNAIFNPRGKTLMDWGEGVVYARQLSDQALMDGAMKGALSRPETGRQVIQEISRGMKVSRIINPTYVGSLAGEKIEDMARLAVYLNAQRNLGLSRGAAANMADTVLYDYAPELLTQTERNVLKKIMPFYTWARRNIPRMVQIAFKNPGYIAAMGHVYHNAWNVSGMDPEIQPDWQRDLLAMPVPGTANPQANYAVMWNPNIPIQDLQKLDVLRRTGWDFKDQFSGLAPAIKMPIEMGTGTEVFYGSDIDEGVLRKAPGLMLALDKAGLKGNPAWEALIERLGGERNFAASGEEYLALDPNAVYAIRNASPWLNTVSKLVDPTSEKINYDLFSMLTGLKVQPYDVARYEKSKRWDDKDKLDKAWLKYRRTLPPEKRKDVKKRKLTYQELQQLGVVK